MKFSNIAHKGMVASLFLLVGIANAQNSVGVSSSGTGTTGIDPSTFVSQLYLFALSISGLLAMGMIIRGGVEYIISAGNGGRQSAAKNRILNALLGLLLLIGSYILLNTLNPAIVSLQFPQLCNNGSVPAGTPCQPLTPP